MTIGKSDPGENANSLFSCLFIMVTRLGSMLKPKAFDNDEAPERESEGIGANSMHIGLSRML